MSSTPNGVLPCSVLTSSVDPIVVVLIGVGVAEKFSGSVLKV